MTFNGLQVSGLGQAHEVYGGVNHVCDYSPPTLNLREWCEKTT